MSFCLEKKKCSPKLFNRGKWQANDKTTSFIKLTLDRDLTLMKLHDVLGYGQSQSGSAHFSGTRFIHPVEPLKNSLPVFRRNADAIV